MAAVLALVRQGLRKEIDKFPSFHQTQLHELVEFFCFTGLQCKCYCGILFLLYLRGSAENQSIE